MKLQFALMVAIVSLLSHGEVRRLAIEDWRTFPPRPLIENGDLVFRRDNGIWSRIFINASTRERRFSHTGIVAITNGRVRIIHADANEQTGKGRVRSEEWCSFFSESADGALFRYNGDAAIRNKIADEAKKRLNVPFDSGFDMSQTNKLYCSEFVRESVNAAVGRQVIGYTKVTADRGFVAVDDCYRSEMSMIAECGANAFAARKSCERRVAQGRR
ncbi:MAG TPA: hypothetical protein DD637_00885 [Verrucomicrobia bacterium]|nr:hypothetical protein [Verrucomicrobiota bacterium]